MLGILLLLFQIIGAIIAIGMTLGLIIFMAICVDVTVREITAARRDQRTITHFVNEVEEYVNARQRS